VVLAIAFCPFVSICHKQRVCWSGCRDLACYWHRDFPRFSLFEWCCLDCQVLEQNSTLHLNRHWLCTDHYCTKYMPLNYVVTSCWNLCLCHWPDHGLAWQSSAEQQFKDRDRVCVSGMERDKSDRTGPTTWWLDHLVRRGGHIGHHACMRGTLIGLSKVTWVTHATSLQCSVHLFTLVWFAWRSMHHCSALKFVVGRLQSSTPLCCVLLMHLRQILATPLNNVTSHTAVL